MIRFSIFLCSIFIYRNFRACGVIIPGSELGVAALVPVDSVSGSGVSTNASQPSLAVGAWPPDSQWPFTVDIPASSGTSHLPHHRAMRFTLSQPGPLPVTDLSKIAREALVSFSHETFPNSPTTFTFPPGPYGARRQGPFVTLNLAFPQIHGVDMHTLVNNEIQPLWKLYLRQGPMRSMRVAAAVELNGHWTPVAHLDIHVDVTAPENPLASIPHLPFGMSSDPFRYQVKFDTYRHKQVIIASGYARYALITSLMQILEEITLEPQHTSVLPHYWHVSTPFLHWNIEMLRKSPEFTNEYLALTLHTILSAITGYGAFETNIEVTMGRTVVANMRIYEYVLVR